MIASGVEAIVIIDVPYFYPEQARAAVAAGLHVYMAKPVAVDVPGTLAILAAGKAATQQQRVFQIDYQIPTDPINIEVAQRIRDGALGQLAQIQTAGMCGGFGDPPRTANLEGRLQKLTWINDIALGCDYIGNFDIHAIDAALWVAGQRPVVFREFSLCLAYSAALSVALAASGSDTGSCNGLRREHNFMEVCAGHQLNIPRTHSIGT